MFERFHPRRLVVAIALSLGVIAAGCGRDDTATPPTIDQRAATETSIVNPFIPDDVNIGDCVSSLPRPGCGNQIRGDWHSMITFGVLVAGLAFIGWRIARSVRRRDAPRGPAPTDPTPADRPTADRPTADRPTADRPTADRPPADRTPTA